MNERTKELAEQAGVTFDSLGASYTFGSLQHFLERFAELVRQDEREVCAKLVEEVGRQTAAAIRARGEKHD